MIHKVIFIVPGYRHSSKNKAYKEVYKLLKKEKYKPMFVNIPWNKTTISENVEYFVKKFRKVDANEKYILGFSFGAMIAFITSTKVKVNGLILCSLPPYFKEDLSKLDEDWNSSLMSRRFNDFSGFSFTSLAERIKAEQVLILYGTKEEKLLKKRVVKVYDEILSKRKYLIPIKKTDHNIGDKRYLDKIHFAAKYLAS